MQQGPILIVEDDDVILSTMEYFLTDEGFTVIVAANGKEALDRVAQTPPALILLDMKMPVMDGWAFATAYRERPGPHAPIIVVTAAHDSRKRAEEIAADNYIAKPFDLHRLLELVRLYIPQP